MIVYLCGPMAGRPRCNETLFDAAAALCRSLDYHVLSPLECSRDLHGFDLDKKPSPEELRRFWNWDINAILTCQALVLLPEWWLSHHGKIEIAMAVPLGRKFFYYEPENNCIVPIEPPVIYTNPVISSAANI